MDADALQARVAFLEGALAKERARHDAHLREISSAAGVREVRAMSLCASWRGASLDSSGSEQANVGPGLSPNDSESRRPPQGAEHTPASGRVKLEQDWCLVCLKLLGKSLVILSVMLVVMLL